MAILTAQGLQIRRYPEIVKAIQDAALTNISSELSFDEDLLITQIVNIIAVQLSNLEETLQVLNDARDRDKAEGSALDELLWVIGLRRLKSGRSAGEVTFVTREDVTIPTDTFLMNPSNRDRFRTTGSVIASPRACRAVWYSIEVANERTYTVTVEGSDFSFTSDETATNEEIIAGLSAAINAVDAGAYTAASDSPAGVPLLRISSKTEDNIDTSVVQYLSAERVKIKVPVQAIEVGPIQVPPAAITSLLTGLGGVFFLVNEESFGVGRFRETDAEFRLRASQSLAVSGSSTYAALFTALSNLPEVSEVVLLENSSAAVVEGLPAHSFEAIVNIPDTAANDTLIANTLWNEKPIGIQSHGTVTVNIVDDIGQSRTLKFSRPEDVFIAIKVTYTLYDEETPPEFLSDIIKAAVLAYGNSLSAGVDVIPRRFIGPIYTATGSGLEDVTVEAQVLALQNDAPVELDWSEAPIDIIPRKTARFQLSKIILSGPA